MKLAALFENEDKYLYHVTFTKNVPKIKEKGLLQFQPSNWVRRGDQDKRYNEDAGIFAFTHPEDAWRWAFKMQWDMDDKDISIVRINVGDHWHDDPAEDPMLAVSQKGKARRSHQHVKPQDVIDSFRLEDFGNPQSLKIDQQEWVERIVKKLRS